MIAVIAWSLITCFSIINGPLMFGMSEVYTQPVLLVPHESKMEVCELLSYHMKLVGRNCSELASWRSRAITPILCNLYWVTVHHPAVCVSIYCLLLSCTFVGILACPCWLQKLPYASGSFIFISICTSYLPRWFPYPQSWTENSLVCIIVWL